MECLCATKNRSANNSVRNLGISSQLSLHKIFAHYFCSRPQLPCNWWNPFTQRGTTAPGSHWGAGGESEAFNLCSILTVTFCYQAPVSPRRTQTHWPFKDPWPLNGGPWPSWHREDPDPAHFPFSNTILSSLNGGVSGLEADVILPSTCNPAGGNSFFCCIKRQHFEHNLLQQHAIAPWIKTLVNRCKIWRSRRQLSPWESEESTNYFYFLAQKGKSDDLPLCDVTNNPDAFATLVTTTPPAQVLVRQLLKVESW